MSVQLEGSMCKNVFMNLMKPSAVYYDILYIPSLCNITFVSMDQIAVGRVTHVFPVVPTLGLKLTHFYKFMKQPSRNVHEN